MPARRTRQRRGWPRRGGGRPNFAQAGGNDPAKLAEAVAAGVAALKEQLGG